MRILDRLFKKDVEKEIISYVKMNQPVYIGEILKELKLSQIKGQQKIVGLLHEGKLNYAERYNQVQL